MALIYLAKPENQNRISDDLTIYLSIDSHRVYDRENYKYSRYGRDMPEPFLNYASGTIALYISGSENDSLLLADMDAALKQGEKTNGQHFFLIVKYGEVVLPDRFRSISLIQTDITKPFYDQLKPVLKFVARSAAPYPIDEMGFEFGYSIQHWIIKINEATWDIDDLKRGDTSTFNSFHHQNQRQNDYDYFSQVERGDHIFGLLLPDTKAVAVCFYVMDIVKHKNDDIVLTLTVSEKYPNPIPIEALSSLPYYGALDYKSDEKLYPLRHDFIIPLLHNARADTTADLSPNDVPSTPPAPRDLATPGPADTLPPVALDVVPSDPILPPLTAIASDISLIYQIPSLTAISPDIPSFEVTDDLGFRADVRAMAAVIAFKDVSPPLSIGLFGNWGSGKSFFMHKLEKEIAALAGSDPDVYCSEIIPIHFNSWHYSDANLWASLSSRIFEALDQYGRENKAPDQLENLYRNLHSTTEQIRQAAALKENAEKKLEVIQQAFAAKNMEVQQKAERLSEVSFTTVAKAVLSNKFVKEKIDAVKKDAGFVDWEDIESIKKNGEELKGAAGKIIATAKQAYSFRNLKAFFALALVGVVLVIGYVLHRNLALVSGWYKQLEPFIVGAGVLLSQLLVFIKPAMSKVNEVSAVLTSLSGTIGTLQEQEAKKQQREMESARTELSSAQTELSSLVAQQTALEQAKAQLDTELADIRSGKKVSNFVHDRLADKRYVDSLGMISWIRKDFEQLDYLLKQQYTAELRKAEQGIIVDTFKIDRIVLYIDDLDRCEAAVVVKVLEAIHLLLAFPLFIVIVGVDPRWMENALTKTFTHLKKDGASNDAELEEVVTPRAYLEKIFQIPFRLKSMDKTGFESLISSQFKTTVETPAAPEPDEETFDAPAEKQAVINLVTAPVLRAAPIAENKPDVEETIITPVKKGKAKAKMPEPVKTVPIDDTPKEVDLPIEDDKPKPGANTKKSTAELLVISAKEISFIQAMYNLLPNSPRTIKRFVNIYRIIRSHADLQVDDDDIDGFYEAAIIMLAVSTGTPDKAELLFAAICKADPHLPFKQFLENDEIVANFPELITWYKNSETDAGLGGTDDIPLAAFQTNWQLVNRFTF